MYYWNTIVGQWEARPELFFADYKNPAFDGPGHCGFKKLPPLPNLNTEADE